jgi:hypothetical protein
MLRGDAVLLASLALPALVDRFDKPWSRTLCEREVSAKKCTRAPWPITRNCQEDYQILISAREDVTVG